MSTGAPRPIAGIEAPRRGLAIVVVMIGVMITAIDTTIVVLALPEIERSLHVALDSVIWVVIGHLLVITLLATQVGRLGDMFGRVKMYEAGFVVFIVGSALCALSFNETSIVVFRLLQGVGGALVTANSGAVIADLFPREHRGRAYGSNSVGFSVGAVCGILLGGAIVTSLSWRWIFWINVPIGLIGVGLALRVLRERTERAHHRLDPLGMASLALGLFGILWAVTKLATKPLDAELLGYLLGGLVMVLCFVLIERSVDEPMLDLSLFKVPAMTPSLLAAFFQGLANYAVLFLVIMYLQGARHLSPIHASVLLVPGYLVGAVVGPTAGRLADRFSPVLPATTGLAVQVIALFIYAHLSPTTGLWLVVLASVVNGLGASSLFPANNAAVMKASPARAFGISSGMLRTFANVGMVFSFSLAILVASRRITRRLAFAIFVGSTSPRGDLAAAFTTGLHAAFYASMGIMAMAAVLSATRATRIARNQPASRPHPGAGMNEPSPGR